MCETPEQPGRYPTATKAAQVPPTQVVLEYCGPGQPLLIVGTPWYIRLACVITCIAAVLVILVSATVQLSAALDRGMVIIPLGAALFGAVVLIWEHEAVRQCSRAAAIAVGCVGLAISLPLCLTSAKAMQQPSIEIIIPITLAGGSLFCAVAHFLWAMRLRPPRSRSGRV